MNAQRRISSIKIAHVHAGSTLRPVAASTTASSPRRPAPCICAPTPPLCCIFSRKFHVPRSSEQLTWKIWLRALTISSSPLHFCFFSSQHPLPNKTGLLQRRLLTFNAMYEKHSRFTRSTRLQPCALLFTSTSRSQATSSTSPTRSRCSRRAASRHVPPAYSISTPRASSVSVFRTRHSGT